MTYCCPFNFAVDLFLLVFVIIPFLCFVMPSPDDKKYNNKYNLMKGQTFTEIVDLSKMGANSSDGKLGDNEE